MHPLLEDLVRSLPDSWAKVAPGVVKSRDWNLDRYIGDVQTLLKAGLVRPEHLPGAPGMPKTAVRLFPDGTVSKGAKTATYSGHREPGAKHVRWYLRSAGILVVDVRIGWEEKERRREEDEASDERAQDERAELQRQTVERLYQAMATPRRPTLRLVHSGSGSDAPVSVTQTARPRPALALVR